MKSIPKGLLHSRQQLIHEYQELQKIDRSIYSREKKSSNHRAENRYRDVIPYESTRVKMQYPTKYTVDGYINASFVSPDGSDVHRYIASQGPLENTVGAFWQCVLEEIFLHDKIVVNVIMLTELKEGNHEKCFDYIKNIERDVPQAMHDVFNVDFDQVKFSGLQTLNEGGIELREFVVTTTGGQEKIARHVWVRRWPDFGVPSRLSDNNEYVIKYLSGADSKAGVSRNEVSSVVHCSAGVGRSGTYIAMDWYYNEVFQKQDKEMESRDDVVFSCVANLRKSRVMMVQRFEQYEYLYHALRDFYGSDEGL